LNNDNQKVLEYVVGHELGHFFLLSKNHKNPTLDKNKFIQKIARNIEEGFSEAFSIQLMCLKDSDLNFNNVKQ
jgi:Zn-dependent peptidase ImmA (M78 family)